MLYSNDLSHIAFVSQAASDFLAAHDVATLAPGRYELGNGECAKIEEFTPFPREERLYEAHRAFIDIQMVVFGAEICEVAPLDACEVASPYDAEVDCAAFSGETRGEQYVLTPGRFIAVWPEDAHMPAIAPSAHPAPVRKLVFKIRA